MSAAVRGHALAVTLLLAGTVAAGAQSAREAPGSWAFRKAITVPALTEPTSVEVRLDVDVTREALPSLADLRVRDDTGADVAYVVRRRDRGAVLQTRETPMLELVTTPDGVVRFVLDAGAGARHGRVRLSIRDQVRNFRVPVRVETADETRAWQIAREAGFIYRVEGETRTAETSVSYPVTTARWVRVTVGAEKGRPLPLAGAAIILGDAPAREEDRVPATIVDRDAESMRRTTRLVLDLRARRAVDRVEVDVAERTFNRVVLVEASDDRKSWRGAGSAAISAVDFAGMRERLTSLRFAETTARFLRLTIQNLDDPPLTVGSARAYAVKRALVFEALPGRSYVLDYGNPRATAPRHDERGGPTRDGRPTATVAAARAVSTAGRSPWPAVQPVAAWATTAMAALALGSLGWRIVQSRSASDGS